MVHNKKLIVIGGGITGLSSTLAWCKNMDVENNPVTLIEKQPTVGGFVTTFAREGYMFDTTQIIPDVKDILDYLEMDIKLKKFEGYFARIFLADPKTGNVKHYKIPSGLIEFEYYLINMFPGDAKKIKKLFLDSKKLYDELYQIKYCPSFSEKLKIFFTCRQNIRNANKTFKQFFDRYRIKSPVIREIFNVFAAFSGLPAERVSALLTIGAMHSTLSGAFRPEKGFIDFPLEYKKHILDNGGKIITNREVVKILTKSGKVQGVQLDDGEIMEADYVITSIDPKVAMLKLVGKDILEKYGKSLARKVETMKMSPSSIHIGLGLDDKINLDELGLNCGYNVLSTGGDTFEQLFEACDLGKASFSSRLFHCSVIAPSMANQQKSTLIIRAVPMPHENWEKLWETNKWLYEKEKNDIADFFIELVEKYLIPNLSKHIVVKTVATPSTFSRFSGSPTGSNYDMAAYPDNYGKNRLPMITPIKNLLQPKMSHGIWPCMQSGLQAVDYILDGVIMKGYARYKK